MIQVPLPKTIKGSKVFPKQTEYLVNLIATDGGLISRPALTRVASLTGQPRGMFVYNNKLYSVFGGSLYSGTESPVLVGAISGAEDVSVARGFTQAAIATGGTAYTLSLAGALASITDPDLPACKSVTRIRGRFVWVPTDGESLIFSEVDQAGNIGPSSRFDAESYPDRNVAVENIRDDLYALNEESIEPFRDVGTEDFPFVPVTNSVISVGYVGGKILTKDSILFLGKDKDSGYAFYVLGSGVAEAISPPTINEMLNRDYTRDQLAGVRAQRFNWRGIDCYVFSLSDRTFLFQNGYWSYLDEGVISPTRFSSLPYFHAVLLGATWYLQSSDGIYKLTDAKEDTRGPFARQFTTYARSTLRQRMSLKWVELENMQGTSLAAGSVGLSLSKNNQIWSNPLYANLAPIGRYNDKLRWSALGGLGMYDGLIAMNVYTTDPIEFSADNMLMEI